MTTIVQRRTAHQTRSTFATGPIAKVSNALRRLLAQIASGLSRQAVNRRVLRKLAVMSDRELKDIGLVRQDVEDAGSGVGDASLLLLARRDERRAARAS